MAKQASGQLPFVMDVVDTFAFKDGRTVIAGLVTTGPPYISACDCELVVAGKPVAEFSIEGEMLPLKRQPNQLRAVSTRKEIDLGLIRRSKGRCKLRSV
jgi:hypothetical protein